MFNPYLMRERKAFTLIEMLIVVAIIAILAMIAVGAYGSARRSAQIDLMADNLVSSLKYQQSLSKAGKVVRESDQVGDEEQSVQTKCYGMYFSKNGGESGENGDGTPLIQFVETPYYAVHPKKPAADVCELSEAALRDFDIEFDLELFTIQKYGIDQESDRVLIMFKPPFGRIFIGDDLNSIATPERGLTPFIKFGIRYPDSDDEKFFRFDTSTGLTERVYE